MEIKKQLQQLGNNHAGVFRYKNGRDANYGSIRVEGDYFVHFTGKGLREMFKHDEDKQLADKLYKVWKGPNGEEILVKSEHIAFTPISEIELIVH